MGHHYGMETRNTASGELHGGLVQAGVVHGDVVQVVNVGESHGPNDVRVGLGWWLRPKDDPEPHAAPWDFFWKEITDPVTYEISIANLLPRPLGISDAGFVLRRALRFTGGRGGRDIAKIPIPETQFPLDLKGNARARWSVSSEDLSEFAKFQNDPESEQFLIATYAVTLNDREFNGHSMFPGRMRCRGTRMEAQFLKRKSQGAVPSDDV